MLSRRLLVRKQLTRLTWLIKYTRLSSQVAVEPETTGGSSEIRLSAVKAKQPTREPFAKNLFLGKFDIEFLTYPESQTSDRHRDFFEWLKPIEDYVKNNIDVREIDLTSKVKNEIFEKLQKLGVLRAAIDETYGGLGLTCSEYAKLVETISVVPVLGTYLTKRATIISLIKKYGTEQQKSDILPKIASGEIIPTLCFPENSSGSTTEPLMAKSVISNCRTFYTVNARKTWVFDATRANVFFVMAQNSSSDAYVKSESLSAFLIPRSSKGVSIEQPVSILGQHGIDLCTVHFTNVEIPFDAKLGIESEVEELYVSVLEEEKLNVGAQAIGILKNFLNNLTTYLLNTKNFNSKKNQEDSMHDIVGKIASTLYAMEATTYMTAGMIDSLDNQDSALEKSLVASYCTNACIEEIFQGMIALGSSGYDMNQPFEKFLRDSLAVRFSDRSALDTKIFAALLGLQYAGLELGHQVIKGRNPVYNPLSVFRSLVEGDRVKKLHLEDNLHPSLRTAAMSLEISVHNLKKIIKTLFMRDGAYVLSHRMDVRRVADILIEVYTMTAVISRASRSYCIGMRNSDDEVRVAMIFTYKTFEKIKSILTELEDGDWANGDLMIKEVAESIFQKKEYCSCHPLERNF